MSSWGHRRKRTEAHEKSMWKYEIFAWHDAVAIADLLARRYPIQHVRKIFESFDKQDLIRFEQENKELIGDFIQKSEKQRANYLDKISNHELSNIVFLVIAIIAVIRVKGVLELRDRYRLMLAPGRGNRITNSALYEFSMEMLALFNYSWPEEAFTDILDDIEDD